MRGSYQPALKNRPYESLSAQVGMSLLVDPRRLEERRRRDVGLIAVALDQGDEDARERGPWQLGWCSGAEYKDTVELSTCKE